MRALGKKKLKVVTGEIKKKRKKKKEGVKHPLEELDRFIGVELTTCEDYKYWDSHLNQTMKSMARYYEVDIDERDRHPFLQAEVNCLMMCIQNVRYWMRTVAKVRFGQKFELERDQFKIGEYLKANVDHGVLEKMTQDGGVAQLTQRQNEALKKIDLTFEMFRLFAKTMMHHFYKTLNWDIINNIVEEVLHSFPLEFC